MKNRYTMVIDPYKEDNTEYLAVDNKTNEVIHSKTLKTKEGFEKDFFDIVEHYKKGSIIIFKEKMTLENLQKQEGQQFSEHLEDILSNYDAAHLIGVGTGDILDEVNTLHERGLKELIIAYAEQKCKEQREICAKEMESNTPVDFEGYPIGSAPTGSILNAPLPKFD